MKKIINFICMVAVVGGASSQASVIIVDDDFGMSTVSEGLRFVSGDIDSGNWVQRRDTIDDRDTPDPTDDVVVPGGSWAISGGELTNSGDNDQGAFLLNSVSSTDTSLTQITVSFDYTVGAGSTLYFHSALYTGGTSTTGNISRITQDEGAYFANGNPDFNVNFGSALNLRDGTLPTGAASEALTSFAGNSSGTFTQTYDISGYTGVSSIADISHILAAFTLDTAVAGDGGITIDNFNVVAVVPEPSTFGLLGLGCVGCLLRRRRA